MMKGKKNRSGQLSVAQRKAAELEYELGRWKKAVDTRNKIIENLQGDLKLAQAREQANEGLVAVLLGRLGADKENPQTVEHDAVQDAQRRLHVCVRVNEEDMSYSLHVVAVEE